MSSESKTDHVFSLKPREFAQERARRTFEALVSAAEQEFSELGFDATQTPTVAQRAGVSVGTFYRYFQDKKDILLEVLKRELTLGREQVLGALTPEGLLGSSRRETMARALRILLEYTNRNPGLQRVYLEMSLRDPDVARLRKVYEQEACDRIAVLIGSVCSEEEVPDPQATAYVVFTSVVECVSAIAGTRGESAISAERRLSALTELVLRALFANA